MLAVIALAVVTVILAREGKRKYLWVSAAPMLLVATTTTTAAMEMLYGDQVTISTQLAKDLADYAVVTSALISAGLIVAMVVCTYVIVWSGILRVFVKGRDVVPEIRGEAAF